MPESLSQFEQTIDTLNQSFSTDVTSDQTTNATTAQDQSQLTPLADTLEADADDLLSAAQQAGFDTSGPFGYAADISAAVSQLDFFLDDNNDSFLTPSERLGDESAQEHILVVDTTGLDQAIAADGLNPMVNVASGPSTPTPAAEPPSEGTLTPGTASPNDAPIGASNAATNINYVPPPGTAVEIPPDGSDPVVLDTGGTTDPEAVAQQIADKDGVSTNWFWVPNNTGADGYDLIMIGADDLETHTIRIYGDGESDNATYSGNDVSFTTSPADTGGQVTTDTEVYNDAGDETGSVLNNGNSQSEITYAVNPDGTETIKAIAQYANGVLFQKTGVSVPLPADLDNLDDDALDWAVDQFSEVAADSGSPTIFGKFLSGIGSIASGIVSAISTAVSAYTTLKNDLSNLWSAWQSGTASTIIASALKTLIDAGDLIGSVLGPVLPASLLTHATSYIGNLFIEGVLDTYLQYNQTGDAATAIKQVLSNTVLKATPTAAANLGETIQQQLKTVMVPPTFTNDATALPLPVNGASSQYVVVSNAGSLYVQNTASGQNWNLSLPGVQEIAFTNGVGVFDSTGTAEDVARIYQATLGRAPDAAGLEYWTGQIDGSNVPLSAVATAFTSSPEFIQDYGSLSDAAFVNQLYKNVLGRPADAAGASYWDGVLGSGTSRGTVVLGFAESQEFETDTLSSAGDQNNAEAYRLYQAALNRAPDTTGLAYWSATLAKGATPTQVAQDFIGSAEFQKDYGTAPSANDFVSLLYENVLHRAPDAAGLEYWTNALQQGASQASVLVGFSDGLENRLQTAGATHANWVFIPN